MSALNNGKAITTQVSYEYLRTLKTPNVTGLLRGALPSYASSFLHVLQAETVTVACTVPAFTLSNSVQIANGTIALTALSQITLSSTDVGQIMFANISLVSVSNAHYTVGHPTVQLINSNGQPIAGGNLAAGSYHGLAIKVTSQVNSTLATAAGSLSFQVTAILMGTVTQ